MRIFKGYIEYLKDNPEKYWFKRKLYGWGWVPVRWQGWFVIVVFVSLLLLNGFSISSGENPTSAELRVFFAKIILYVAVIIFICYKTGEKPRWQWGREKKD